MARTPLTDEEKLRRGTLDARTSEAGRARREVAKVLAFPVLRKVPKPSFPLGERGRQSFDYWTRRLHDAELLTAVSLGKIENLALADDEISAKIAGGKSVPVRLMEKRDQSLNWLQSLNVDGSVISGETKKSAFASHGFPNRLRTPAEHRARVAG